MLELIRRCPEYLSGYRDYCSELRESGCRYFCPMKPELVDEAWYYRTKDVYDRREKERIDGRARSVHYWAVDDGRFIGEFQLRLDFTGNVMNDIGSVGLAVRPTEWRKGYGSAILQLGLDIARSFGMEELLLTIDEENIASIRTAEKLGAVYADTIEGPCGAEEMRRLRRYRITL